MSDDAPADDAPADDAPATDLARDLLARAKAEARSGGTTSARRSSSRRRAAPDRRTGAGTDPRDRPAALDAPETYADGVLTVRAESTAWATQLRLLAPTLVARLNADLGDGTVTRVTVLGPDGPSWRKGRLRVKGRGPRDTYG